MRVSQSITLPLAMLALLAAGIPANAAADAPPARQLTPDREFLEREAKLQRATASAIFNVEMRMAATRLEIADETCSGSNARRQRCLAHAQLAHGSALDTALGRLQQSQSIAAHLEASNTADD